MGKRRELNIPAPPKSGGGWIMTFADLMSLLMAFFVLLFSLSEVDKSKFEMFGLSLKAALGSPDIMKALRMGDKPHPIKPNKAIPKIPLPQPSKEKTEKQSKQDAEKLKNVLAKQIVEKQVEVIQKGRTITIRLVNKSSFKAGAAELVPEIRPVIAKITATIDLDSIQGRIVVSGHTDDVPIDTHQYRSNWELSAARSYSVIEEMMNQHKIPANRFELRGFGDTKPLVPNNSEKNRAKNRRIEIMIDQSDAPVPKEKAAAEKPQTDPAVDGQEVVNKAEESAQSTAKSTENTAAKDASTAVSTASTATQAEQNSEPLNEVNKEQS